MSMSGLQFPCADLFARTHLRLPIEPTSRGGRVAPCRLSVWRAAGAPCTLERVLDEPLLGSPTIPVSPSGREAQRL
jgi:hypothetical protein